MIFTDTKLAGTTHSSIPDLIYLDLEIDGGGSISGYVPTRVAKLVKAAPELLEALSMLVAHCDRIGVTTRDDEPYLEAANAAIAKATT